jgi:hypothetical protein
MPAGQETETELAGATMNSAPKVPGMHSLGDLILQYPPSSTKQLSLFHKKKD